MNNVDTSLKRILVVDDNQSALRLWARTLQKEGFEVITSINGHTAIEELEKNQFSVIFTDLNMPSLGGMELLKYCREKNIQSCVNILTGVASVQGAVECMKLGACDFLAKPCELSEVVATANRCCAHYEQKRQLKDLQDVVRRLEELDRMKTELISNVSHELRTPLFSLGAAFDLLFSEIEGTLANNQKRLSEVIQGNYDRLTKIVTNILNLSRLDRGTFKPDFQRFDVSDFLRKSYESFTLLAAKKEVQIILEMPQDVGVMEIEADPDQINQIVTNLFGNSLKFTPERGQIGIGYKDRGPHIEMEIWDTGRGIPKESLSRIFERFFQVDGTITREVGGLGIGLAIVKGIVENHSGKIWMESDLGKGTRCHICLPKRQAGKEESHNAG